MSYQPIPRGTPESAGLSSVKMLLMVRELESCGTEMHGLMLYRSGKVVLEGWWKPFTKETVHINHSFGKTYVATAVGVACRKGLLSVEDRIADLFGRELKQWHLEDSGNLAKLKVKHVLSMTNGMAIHPDGGTDIVHNYLTTPIENEPGSVFMYNTTGSSMLGEIVRRVSGMSLFDFMRREVFEPAGFDTDHFRWMAYGNGLHAAPGVATCTENNLRLGLLYLKHGEWKGQQIMDRQWVADATRKQIDNHSFGYGYQMWMNEVPGSFRFVGGHGQDCLISRPQDLVVAVHQAASEPHDTDAVNHILNRYLLLEALPDSLPENPQGVEQLNNYLESRSIPQRASQPAHAFADGWEGCYNVIDGQFHLNPELLPFGDVNVNREFYDTPDVDVQTLKIERCEEGFAFTLNAKTRLIARLDGQWLPHPARSAMPNFDASCATVVVEDQVMIVDQWFYQTCFKSRLWLERDGDLIRLRVRKERLHDGRPYIWREAILKRID